MEWNREEAARAKKEMMRAGDYVGAQDEGAAKKRRKTGEEFENVVKVEGFDDVGGTKRGDGDECNKRIKQNAQVYTQLQKRMDEMEKRLKQHEDCICMHECKKKMMKPTHVKPDIMKVQELAVVWKEKIRNRTLRSSSIKVLDFLQFIAAYRLQNSIIINQEETAKLASSVASYKEAPTLFQSLGLDHLVPEFVEQLINKRIYIPAVRHICFFKLKGFSPLDLLKKEITSIRTEPQDEYNLDGMKLREIIELAADYKLELDIPGELIVKLMDMWS